MEITREDAVVKAIRLCQKDFIELAEVPVPAPGDHQMLIKTGAAVICTSDVIDIHENPFNIALPTVMGHEGAGTVVQVGAAVQGFQVGDRVATHPVHPCGDCPACRDGNQHLCLNLGHFGINMPGTMAEYYLVRADRARRIPDSVDFTLAALAEPVCVCLEALAQARLNPGQSLLIIGDGPFGLMMARLAVDLPLKHLVLSGLESFRLSFAGRAAAVNVSGLDDPAQALLDRVSGEGYDSVILAVASQAAFQQGFACLKPKGRLVLFAAAAGRTPVDLFTVHIKELEIIGACNDQDRFDEAVQKLSDPALNLSQLVTHTFPIEDYQQAFGLAANGKDQAIKVAFTF